MKQILPAHGALSYCPIKISKTYRFIQELNELLISEQAFLGQWEAMMFTNLHEELSHPFPCVHVTWATVGEEGCGSDTVGK